MHKLYLITNKVNEKLYIGITKLSINDRWKKHRKDSINPKYPLQRAIKKYGEDNFAISTLVISDSRKYISSLEEPAIIAFNSRKFGYNVALGGYGGDLGTLANAKRSQTVKNKSAKEKAEISRKLSAKRLGKNYITLYGVEKATLLKERLSKKQLLRGGNGPKTQSTATREKISIGNTGKIRSAIAKEHYSKAAKIRGTGPQLQGKKVSCLCCRKDWDLGNYSQHITRRNTNELQ